MCLSFPQILYVDGDADCCEIVRMILDQSGSSYDLTTLYFAEDALALIAKRSFDLYIFDQPWRKPSGLELCKKVRENDPHVPILIFSVLSGEIDRGKAKTAGASAYLVKANDIDEIADTIERLLDQAGPKLETAA